MFYLLCIIHCDFACVFIVGVLFILLLKADFILAIGYYITPALVGGASGTLISNQIAYHMKATVSHGHLHISGCVETMLTNNRITYNYYKDYDTHPYKNPYRMVNI